MTDEVPGLARYIDAVSAPVELSEVIDRHRGRRPRRVVAVAFVAVAAATLAVVALVPRRVSEAPPGSTPATSVTTVPTDSGRRGCADCERHGRPARVPLDDRGLDLWRAAAIHDGWRRDVALDQCGFPRLRLRPSVRVRVGWSRVDRDARLGEIPDSDDCADHRGFSVEGDRSALARRGRARVDSIAGVR